MTVLRDVLDWLARIWAAGILLVVLTILVAAFAGWVHDLRRHRAEVRLVRDRAAERVREVQRLDECWGMPAAKRSER